MKDLFEGISDFLDPLIGKFNLREKMVHLTLDGVPDTAANTAFCTASYKAVLFLCMVWPYGGKQKLTVIRKTVPQRGNKDPLFVDKLLLSVFNMYEEFSIEILDDSKLQGFILDLFSKVKKVVVKRNKTTEKPHFLKTVWEKELLGLIQWTCYQTVSEHVYMYSLQKYVFFCLYVF